MLYSNLISIEQIQEKGKSTPKKIPRTDDTEFLGSWKVLLILQIDI
jgi:hypothetical protein